MQENIWYSAGEYTYIMKLKDLYVVFWNKGISIVDSVTDWSHVGTSKTNNKFPNWKQNLIKTIFKQKIETEGEYRGIFIVKSKDQSWNWGN